VRIDYGIIYSDGVGVTLIFPDLRCIHHSLTMVEAVKAAPSVLAEFLAKVGNDNGAAPEPSTLERIREVAWLVGSNSRCKHSLNPLLILRLL
jgi:hypothetical protein